MKIYIAMPLYQGEPYLEETLESIQNQTRLPDELVMSDDDSKDSTLVIARQFVETLPFDVKVLHHRPSGITANYLNALRSTIGDVIIFSDQDDVWLINKIELIEKCFMDRQEVAIVSSDSTLVDQHLKPLGTTLRGGKAKSDHLSKATNSGDDFLQFLNGLPLLAHTLAIRTSCKSDILNKPEQLHEWWFKSWVTNVALCHGRLALIPEVLTLYHQHIAQAAGAPSLVKPKLISSVESYGRRIEQLHYCRRLLLRDEANQLFNKSECQHRIQTLDNYVDFLERRITLRQSGWQRWLKSADLLLTGQYHRFSHGWLSFAKDLLSK